jgi:preprotein translocase subunit YajC
MQTLKKISEQIVEIVGKKTNLAALAAFELLSQARADGPVLPSGGAGSPNGALAQQPPGFASMLLPFGAMFVVVYFLMIRPQQKKMKEQQDLLTQLKQGDEVLTTSGILGTITGLTDKVVTLEIAEKVRIKMLKSQVSSVVKGQLT